MSRFGWAFSKRAFGGIIPLSRIRTALRIPASPLAPSKCPIFALTDPLGEFDVSNDNQNVLQHTLKSYSHV
jgi:hypothetical protein